MSEKLDKFISSIKDGNMLSLYYNRIMFYNEGAGEIQFWKAREDEENLIIYNAGVEIKFDNYEIIKSENGICISLSLFLKENNIASFKFPPERKITQNHNTFYVSEFCSRMIETLENNTNFKGDWANREPKYILENLKANASKIKSTQAKEMILQSAVDTANYAMMSYYILKGK